MEGSGGGIGAIIFMLIYFAVIIVAVAGMWKVFAKAGQPGWAVLVPFYNIVVLLGIAGKPVWWIVLFCIPLVNMIIAILVSISVAQAFGKSAGFGIGLAFLGFVFYPLLGFGDAEYQGAPS